MGAAFATLASLDLILLSFLPNVSTITLGSPRVGNSQFAELFNSYVPHSLRLTNNHEIVPSTPPVVFGYHHVATEVFVAPVQSTS